jgi:hypothetical protein
MWGLYEERGDTLHGSKGNRGGKLRLKPLGPHRHAALVWCLIDPNVMLVK